MNLNRNFIRIGLLCLFYSASQWGWAQQEDAESDSVLNMPTSRYLTLGVGKMAVQLNDQHMSPLNYFGQSLYLQVGAFKRKKKSLRNFTMGLTYNTMKPKQDNREVDPRGQYFRLDFAYAQHQYIRSFWKGTTRWYAGGKIKSHSNVRLNPQLDGAFITFLFSNGLYASSVLEREVRISKRPLTINWQLDLPIVNHTIRPSYLNIYDFVNPENDWIAERIKDSEWRSIATFQNITSTVSLLYPISTSNVLRFSYEWDFYHINSELEATNATHTWLFSFLFHF